MIVLKQLLAFAFTDDSSAFEDVSAPGQVEHCMNVLLDDEQTHPVAMQLRENGKYRLDDPWRQAE